MCSAFFGLRFLPSHGFSSPLVLVLVPCLLVVLHRRHLVLLVQLPVLILVGPVAILMILVVVFLPRILTRLLPVLLRHPVLVMFLRVVPPIILLQRRLHLLGVVVIVVLLLPLRVMPPNLLLNQMVVEPQPVLPAFRRSSRPPTITSSPSSSMTISPAPFVA